MEQKIEHTPGPWHKEGNGIYDASPGIPTLIARCTYITPANVHLIAAAPDLLAACETFVEWASSSKTEHTDFRVVLDGARTAIAKAKGERCIT